MNPSHCNEPALKIDQLCEIRLKWNGRDETLHRDTPPPPPPSSSSQILIKRLSCLLLQLFRFLRLAGRINFSYLLAFNNGLWLNHSVSLYIDEQTSIYQPTFTHCDILPLQELEYFSFAYFLILEFSRK